MLREVKKPKVVVSVSKENLVKREPANQSRASDPKSTEIVLNLGADNETNQKIVDEARHVMRRVGHVPSGAKARAVYEISNLHDMEHGGNLFGPMREICVHHEQKVPRGRVD